MRLCQILALLGLLIQGAWAIASQSGPYKVDVRTDPVVPQVGKANLLISVQANGKPVTNATVRVLAQMPGMPMGEKEEPASPVSGQPGVYSAPAAFAMAGTYGVRIAISGPQGSSTVTVPLTTGQSSEQTGVNWSFIAVLCALVAAGCLVAYRMRRTGQRLPMGRMLSAPVIGSLVVLAASAWLAIYAVNHYRRPGAMTPLEAQGMQMSTPAPISAAPVTLASAQLEPFGASITYSGQAVGYSEQDVMPRVTGTLIWMPLYVGDSVKKGQLIAKLDTSQLDPQLAQSQAGLDTAQQAIGVAQSDYSQAQAGVSEAEAELSEYEGALQEAKANLTSAQEDRQAAEAQLNSAQADLSSVEAGVSSAQADQAYYDKQAVRADSLLAAGAISQEQAQRMHADAQKADAGVAQAHQLVSSGQAKVAEAGANIRKADAQILAAKKRVQEAESELMTHHAHVATSVAAAQSSRQKISQAQAEARQARAAVEAAAASKGYAAIVAEKDGVVTDRLISPGTLVNPGQTIVKIAQISPIRLQANVAEADLARVHVGALVSVWHRDTGEQPVIAKVTSVSPSLDPSVRTGTVEAIVPNSDHRFLPGQFVTMQISLGDARPSLTIPSTALNVSTSDGEKFVWVASSTNGGAYTARKVDVQVGAESANKIAVLSGLKTGDRVVVQGGQDLTDGQTVSPQAAGQDESVVAG